MAKKPRGGWGSRITVGGTPLNMGKWEANPKGDDLDTTTFEDGGLETGTIGIEVVEYTIGGNWDAGKNWFDSPPGLFVRDDLAAVNLYEYITDNVLWIFPVSRVLSARNGSEVRGLVSFEASLKSNGTWAYPQGSV